jgi:uncharacterized protein YdaU (DUF1376 family)
MKRFGRSKRGSVEWPVNPFLLSFFYNDRGERWRMRRREKREGGRERVNKKRNTNKNEVRQGRRRKNERDGKRRRRRRRRRSRNPSLKSLPKLHSFLSSQYIHNRRRRMRIILVNQTSP